MELMIARTVAVRKGAPNTFLIGDLPFLSYEVTTSDAIRNAGRFMAEFGCDAVKLEGGRNISPTTQRSPTSCIEPDQCFELIIASVTYPNVTNFITSKVLRGFRRHN
jgi:hypothetical protein